MVKSVVRFSNKIRRKYAMRIRQFCGCPGFAKDTPFRFPSQRRHPSALSALCYSRASPFLLASIQLHYENAPNLAGTLRALSLSGQPPAPAPRASRRHCARCRPQGAPLANSELVEHKQRVVAGAAEMAVVSAAFLLALGRALARIHVEHDHLRWSPLLHLNIPYEDGRTLIVLPEQPFRLEQYRTDAMLRLSPAKRPHHPLLSQSGCFPPLGSPWPG